MVDNFSRMEATQYGQLNYECPAPDQLICPINSQAAAIMSGGTGKNEQVTPVTGTYITHDIAQSHHFRININKIPIEFNSDKFGKFLPVKSINFDEITFESLTIPVGIFGDFPIMHKRKLGRFSLSLYDVAEDKIETALQKWENDCFPQGRYVNYLSEIVGAMKYASYSVEGKMNSELTFLVLPTDAHRVSRGYEENTPKLIQFNLVIVGVVGAKTGGNIPPSSRDNTPVNSASSEVLFSGAPANLVPVTNQQAIDQGKFVMG